MLRDPQSVTGRCAARHGMLTVPTVSRSTPVTAIRRAACPELLHIGVEPEPGWRPGILGTDGRSTGPDSHREGATGHLRIASLPVKSTWSQSGSADSALTLALLRSARSTWNLPMQDGVQSLRPTLHTLCARIGHHVTGGVRAVHDGISRITVIMHQTPVWQAPSRPATSATAASNVLATGGGRLLVLL